VRTPASDFGRFFTCSFWWSHAFVTCTSPAPRSTSPHASARSSPGRRR
jgi:hypothetical protein